MNYYYSKKDDFMDSLDSLETLIFTLILHSKGSGEKVKILDMYSKLKKIYLCEENY